MTLPRATSTQADELAATISGLKSRLNELESATIGNWQSYTPTWTQSATITKTVNWARFTQIGRMVHCSIKMTATGNGTGANAVLVGLPVNASADNGIMGLAHFSTSGATAARFVLYNNATTVRFSEPFSAGITYTNSLTTQVVSGNVIHVQFSYEAA